MDLKPLITIKGTSDLSLGQALKLIKKFHTTCATTTKRSVTFNLGKQEPNVAEDTLDKLNTLMDEIKRRAELNGEKITSSAETNVLFTPSKTSSSSIEPKSSSKENKEKKRKREKSEEGEGKQKDVESSEKKKKKSKKSEK